MSESQTPSTKDIPPENPVIREYEPISNVEMGKTHRNVVPLAVYELENFKDSKNKVARLVLCKGSVVGFDGQAIVNAANEGCLGGGGVDGAISSAGGKELARARYALPIVEGTRSVRCPTGKAVITTGGNLNADYCIHAVGPIFYRFSNDEATFLLKEAYKESLDRANEKQLKNIAFCLLSSGIFRGTKPLAEVISIGVEAIIEYVTKSRKVTRKVDVQSKSEEKAKVEEESVPVDKTEKKLEEPENIEKLDDVEKTEDVEEKDEKQEVEEKEEEEQEDKKNELESKEVKTETIEIPNEVEEIYVVAFLPKEVESLLASAAELFKTGSNKDKTAEKDDQLIEHEDQDADDVNKNPNNEKEIEDDLQPAPAKTLPEEN